MIPDRKIDYDEFEEFRGHIAGLERALWKWSFGKPAARFIHASLGHEVAAFCIPRILPPEQALWALYYRSHAWLLALGVTIAEVVAGISGKTTGIPVNAAGPMHLFLHPNIIDCNSIVGAQVPIAVGAALANRQRSKATVCVLGDGATNTGVFFEALNIAALYKLPVLFVVEDNQIAINTPYENSSGAAVVDKFKLFSVPCFSVSGSDLSAVRKVSAEACEIALKAPAAVHIKKERIGAHVLSAQDTWLDDRIFEAETAVFKQTYLSTFNEALALLGLTGADPD